METQPRFFNRGFLSLLGTQFLGAANDNILKPTIAGVATLIGLAGLSAGFYIVPLQSLLQKLSETMVGRVLFLLEAAVVGGMMGLAVPGVSAQVSQRPTGAQGNFDIDRAPVLKVISAEKDGYRFVAYLVKWKDFDVIVSDPLARTNFRAGDVITFVAQRVSEPQGTSALRFIVISDSPDEPKSLMRSAQAELELARDETQRFCALNRAAKAAMKAGETEEARKLATELERLAPKYTDHWNYGNAVQDANQVLGRIALAEGNVAEAKKRLLASANSKGSPQMNSFGPNMLLAKDLLAKGEKDVVIEYFDRCGKFWEMGADRLAAWTESVRKGETPQFGANLAY
ncbi:MAG: tetratricopeptide repeat protein [Thermoguttaceae bacterium]